MWFIRKSLQQINYKAPEREIFVWAFVGALLYAVGLWLDTVCFPLLIGWQTPFLNALVIWLTEQFIYIILFVFGLVTTYRVWKHPDHQSKLVPAIFAIMTAGILAFVFKSVFAIDRPFIQMALEPLVPGRSYSFPSAHTAVAFALLIPFWRISKFIGLAWFIFAVAVGFARVYELVHFPSDIAAGIFLGGVVGAIFSHREVQKLIKILWEELEFRRQSFHFLFGFFCVFLHWAGVLRLRYIAVILLLGLLISIISQYKKIPIISHILGLFDRPRDEGFPGRGAFYYVAGIFICFLMFPIKIAYAAILILSVGDSLNHLFASQVQKINLPWNRRKNIVGIMSGILMGTFAAQFFVPLFPAFIASSLAILSETIPWRIGRYFIDDNIVVPFVAGCLLSVMLT